MRSFIRQSDYETWPVIIGPIVVFAPDNLVIKNNMINIIRQFAGNRDGPLIFHMRDGPPRINGPPGGTGPPEMFSSGSGPPKITGPPMEWLVKKKNLKKS